MKALRTTMGVGLIVLGLAIAAGRKDIQSDGTPLTVSQRAQDYFGIAAFVLIGASMIIVSRRKNE
jgi:hypothetical protein